MERKLQERMVGAGVLVIALVLLGPMVLDGGGEGTRNALSETDIDELRTHTYRVDGPVSSAKTVPTPARPDPEKIVVSEESPAIARVEAPAAAAPEVAYAPSNPAPITSVPSPRRAPADTVTSGAEAGQNASDKKSSAAPRQSGSAAFLVQVGTFGQKPNAERLAAGLRQRGFEAFVSSTTRDGKTLHRVRVGPADSREKVKVIAERLVAAGQSGQIVRE